VKLTNKAIKTSSIRRFEILNTYKKLDLSSITIYQFRQKTTLYKIMDTLQITIDKYIRMGFLSKYARPADMAEDSLPTCQQGHILVKMTFPDCPSCIP